ncbi:MAG: NPCBM/NEW2 domain-containing protein, partial [Pseudomonadota bacterium]|nr:NPCBM/NEW2 domain-containing protein [Pseudomonadota bacterium]
MKRLLFLAIAGLGISLVSPSVTSGANPVATSGMVNREPVSLHADLRGAKELYLVVTDGGDGPVGDLANWVSPILTKADGSR